MVEIAPQRALLCGEPLFQKKSKVLAATVAAGISVVFFCRGLDL
jgi:hypothetical protein